MSVSTAQATIARRLVREVPDIDQNLPIWARRTNPIVRRQLGMYWRVFPPQIGPLAKWFGVLSAILLATILYPYLFLIVLTVLLAAVLLLPIAFYIWIRALLAIISDSAISIVSEYQNGTLTLLRTTPFTAREIVLSKIAASVWRRMDDLDQVMTFGVSLGMPAIALYYLSSWPPTDYYAVPQILSITNFASTLLRLPMEMFMVAALASMMGAATRLRSTAITSTVILVFFYYLLANLMRLIPMPWVAQLVVDSVLPIVLPLLIGWLAIRATLRLVTRD